MQIESFRKQTIFTPVLHTVVESVPHTPAEGVKQVQKMHTI